MAYNPVLNQYMSQDKLNSTLRKHYHFPLLNFAAVASDVLTNQSILTSNILGITLGEFRKKYAEMEKIEKREEQILKDPLFQSFPDIEKKRRNVIRLSENFKSMIEVINKYFPLPYHKKKPIQLKKSSEIAIIWSLAIIHKRKIQWEEISTLYHWFLERLELDYMPQDEALNIDSIKAMKTKIRKRKEPLLRIAKDMLYFPLEKMLDQRPRIIVRFSNQMSKTFPIKSNKFYKTKIKTIFESENKLYVRESLYTDGKFSSTIREYDQLEEKLKKGLLLDIV